MDINILKLISEHNDDSITELESSMRKSMEAYVIASMELVKLDAINELRTAYDNYIESQFTKENKE